MLHLKSPDICCRFGDVLGSMPFLQHPICRIPVGTWLPETGRGSGHHLVVLRQDAPLSSGLDLLLKGTSLFLWRVIVQSMNYLYLSIFPSMRAQKIGTKTVKYAHACTKTEIQTLLLLFVYPYSLLGFWMCERKMDEHISNYLWVL